MDRHFHTVKYENTVPDAGLRQIFSELSYDLKKDLRDCLSFEASPPLFDSDGYYWKFLIRKKCIKVYIIFKEPYNINSDILVKNIKICVDE